MLKSSTWLLIAVLLTFLVACSSEDLPLGPAPEQSNTYSSAVIVGAIVREPITGRYTVLANGRPIPVSEFNGISKPLSETVEDEELAELIATRARMIASREYQLDEVRAGIKAETASSRRLALRQDPPTQPYGGRNQGQPQ